MQQQGGRVVLGLERAELAVALVVAAVALFAIVFWMARGPRLAAPLRYRIRSLSALPGLYLHVSDGAPATLSTSGTPFALHFDPVGKLQYLADECSGTPLYVDSVNSGTVAKPVVVQHARAAYGAPIAIDRTARTDDAFFLMTTAAGAVNFVESLDLRKVQLSAIQPGPGTYRAYANPASLWRLELLPE